MCTIYIVYHMEDHYCVKQRISFPTHEPKEKEAKEENTRQPHTDKRYLGLKLARIEPLKAILKVA